MGEKNMRIIVHAEQSREQWRPDVVTRMIVSAEAGSRQLCLFEQWCEPGTGAPTHHHAVEEVLTVLEGNAEVWLNEQRTSLDAGQSLIIPAGEAHGFTNVGSAPLHLQFVLASPIFEAAYEDHRETPRRWRRTPRELRSNPD
jgi:mannose-6-phosphate isomerase-like protein (cupin superfamily)